MNSERRTGVKITRTREHVVRSDEFFESHDDAYTTALRILLPNPNDVLKLAE
jgi:hypothetical protein